MVIANGVAINSGAILAIGAKIQGTYEAGVFVGRDQQHQRRPHHRHLQQPARWQRSSNVGGTNFQANYEGGDGNDLTLNGRALVITNPLDF